MPRRGENIRKRKDGRWEGRYKIGNYPSGATKYKSVYGHSYSEVKEKLKLLINEQIENSQTNRSNLLFKDILYLWLNSNKIKHKGATENKYLYLIEKHIAPKLGCIKVKALNSIIINDFLNQKLKKGRLDNKGGLSSSYVRNMSHIISSAISYAVNEQLCIPIKNPIQKPIVEKKDLKILSFIEQQKLEAFLLNNIDETKFAVYLTLNTGLRIGEICALCWDDFDIDNRVIHIRKTVSRIRCESKEQKTILIIDTPKTKASIRDIPISSKLMPIITMMKARSSSHYVLSGKNSFLSPRTLEYRFHRLLDECRIISVNYHALRHTFATRCVEAGVDVKTLSEILGHSDVSITLNIYVHSSMYLKRMQLEKLTFYSA